VRFGSFQRLYWLDDRAGVERLLGYCLEHLLPEAATHAQPALAFLREVCRRSARLCAEWLVAGFVHGVLNSDNMTVTGESFDYGPYRFLRHYDPDFTAAYFDQVGLYAFSKQPRAVYRNLQRLAQSLSILDPSAPWDRACDAFVQELELARASELVRRLGVLPADPDADRALADACWDFLGTRSVEYDALFFDWWGGAASRERALAGARGEAYAAPVFLPLRRLLESRSPSAPERLASEYFQGDAPCSLLIDEIEAIFEPIATRDDFSSFEAKIESIRAFAAATNSSLA
jgi:uncharacterized protein YdiU (UPF0061 family)